MTELEVLNKLTNILNNEAMEDCKKNNPEFLSTAIKHKNELLLMNNLSDIYWYLHEKFEIGEHKDKEKWAKCKYSFEKLPGYIREWLGREPIKLDIRDIKIGEWVTRKTLFVRFKKYHQIWSWLIKGNEIVFYNSDSQANKWNDEDNISVQVAKLSECEEPIIYGGIDRNELENKILNGALVYIFDSVKPYQYEFKGTFTCSSKPYLVKEKGESGSNFYRKRITLTKTLSNILSVNSNNELEKIFVEGEITKQIVETHSRKNIRDEYLKNIKDPYVCRICGNEYKKHNSNEGIIEIHHLHPIHLGTRETRLEDVIGICPNCHRWVHSIKSDHELTLEELKEIYNNAKKNK